MNLKITAGQVFTYMTSVGGTAAYIAWAGIIFTHLRVRSGMERQGIDKSTYPFKAVGSIWIYRFNLLLNIFILFIQGFTAFQSPFNWRALISSYIMIPTSIIFFVGYKWYHGTRWYVVRGRSRERRSPTFTDLICCRVRLSEMDFSDRLVKDEHEEEKKGSRIARLVDKLRD